LRGALPDNYFSRLGLDVTKLASLLDTINDIDTTKDPQNDLVGRVYEYFLSKFALAEGKGKGEFYTPKSIVNLIAEMIEPYKGIIYDPACGSGGMFVQSVKFIEAHNGNKKEVLKAPPKTEVFENRVSNNSINSGRYEKIEIHRNSNCQDSWRTGTRQVGERHLSRARYQPANILWLEEQVRRHGCQPTQAH
jgi:hypothetical protein